jgi:hypothetical protein
MEDQDWLKDNNIWILRKQEIVLCMGWIHLAAEKIQRLNEVNTITNFQHSLEA